MTPWKARGLGFGLLAGACVALLDAAPAWADDAATVTVPPDYTALVLGHAFLPQPDSTYMQEVIDTYVHPTSTFIGEPTYNMPYAMWLDGPLDSGALSTCAGISSSDALSGGRAATQGVDTDERGGGGGGAAGSCEPQPSTLKRQRTIA